MSGEQSGRDPTSAAARSCVATTPAFLVRAPGRVNLIGEHTDYNGGLVLPIAIGRSLALRVTHRDDRTAVLRSEADPATAAFDLDRPLAPGVPGWMAYPAGVIAGFQALGWRIPGFEAVVTGDLPAGAGLSSSAALEVATATAVETLAGRSLAPDAKALLCQRAEHDFAGVPCGIMDQFAVTLGRAGHALLLDCRTREARHVPLDEERVRVLVADSGVRHELAAGGYADRRRECESAARFLGVAWLRDVSADDLRRRGPALPSVERRRAAHVISEHDRTIEFVDAISRSDWPRAGRLMQASHASLVHDFEVSCQEVDLLVALAAAMPGVHGCRMTGGGFGGCVVALVDATRADTIAEGLRAAYRTATGIAADVFVTSPADGVHAVRG